MPLIKTLSQTLKQDKEKFKVPKSVQQAIPIRKIWPDGIFQVESKYSRTFRFTDINYSIASKADKTEMFLDYSELLNALDSGCTAKITLNNRKINKEEFEQSLLIPMKGDGLDEYRKEYNDMLLSKISGTNNSIYQERYLTISVHKKNIDEARTYFARVGTDIITHLAKLSSIGEELDAEQRLQIFRDFFKADVPQSFPFDMKAFAKKGHSFKDWICPDTMEFHNDHFKLGEQYGRVLFMEDYASYVKDEMISELCSLGRNLMLSMDIIPVPTDEAVREIQNRLLGVETNVTNWQRRQNANNNFSAVVPYDMELQRKRDQGNAGRSDHQGSEDDVRHPDNGTYGRQQETTGLRYGNPVFHCEKTPLPDGNFEVATGRWTEYRPAVWPAENRCSAYPYYRIHRRPDPVPYAGNHAAGRHLLWAECRQQKYAGGRPKEAVKRQLFPTGCQRLRQELLGKRGDRRPCPFHGR